VNRRHYKTRRNGLAFYPFLVVTVAVGLSIAVAPGGGFLLPLAGGVFIFLAVWFIKRGMRLGVEVGEEGIVVYGPFSTQRVAWDDVVGLDTHRWSINKIVDLKLRDGHTVNTNLIQGALVTWQGGKTKDILSVLQAEFEGEGRTGTSL
jgi:Bacterial PH domain